MIRVDRSQTGYRAGKRLFAAIAAMLVAALALAGISIPAMAEGVATSKQVFTFSPPEEDTWTAGQIVKFQLGYAYVNNGATATLTIPEGLTVPDEALEVPGGNDAVETIQRQSDGTLLVKFKDPVPAGSDQGVLAFEFKLNAVESSEEKEIKWALNGETSAKIVTILKEGDQKKTYTNATSKNSGYADLGSVVVKDGKVSLQGGSADAVIPYTIKVTSAEARTVTITDTLGDYLELVGPLTGSKVVSDSKGLNSVTSDLAELPNISGQTFTYTFDAEAMSEYTFNYKAKVTDREQLLAALQAEYDKVKDSPGAPFKVSLTNSAVINGETKSADNPLHGFVPQEPTPDVNGAFAKGTDLPFPYETDQIDEDGKLTAPIPVKYTLSADLTKWSEFEGTKHALTQNVVVTDQLPAQISWIAEDEVQVEGAELTKIEGPVDVETFAGESYVGQYFFDGQMFVANLGKKTAQKITITLSAQITTLEGLSQSSESWNVTPTSDLAFLDLLNQAEFSYAPAPDGRVFREVTHKVLRKKDTSDGVVDESKFKKSASGGELSVTKGESAKVPFTFTIEGGIGDAAKSKIVDYIDHSFFDVSEETLPQIKESITGKYAWQYQLDSSSFDVKLVDGNLELTPQPGKGFPEGELTGRLEVTLELPTHPIQGKQTLEIANKASYVGQDSQLQYNHSTKADVTTYGNEMEVQKKVATTGGLEFQNNLRVSYTEDAAGKIKLATDEFVYRVDLVPHGAFKTMVTDVEDVLPSGVEFLGFTNEWGLKQQGVQVVDSNKIRVGNVEASYDQEANRVTISKGKLDGRTTVYFKVKLVEPKADIGITNVIGSASSTITPTNDYPLGIAKLDSQSPEKKISDENAVFQVKNSEGTVVIKDAFVKDGRLVVLKDGEAAVPTVPEPGTYEIVEITPPQGYEKSAKTYSVTVAEDGTSPEVKFFNDPKRSEPEDTGTFSVEKQVKVQGPAGKAVAKALQDVSFTIKATWEGGSHDFTVKPNGGEVQLGKSLPVGTEVTLSENAPSAIDGFVWKEVQFLAGNKVLEDGKFTVEAADEPVRITAVNIYQEDAEPAPIPTPKTYAIGDFTWIDADKDGVQDPGEEVLAGVKVTLLDAEGNPVEGVAPQVTDEFGRYLFDELPAGEYRIKFELTKEQAEIYAFTSSLKGQVGDDSDADPATGLTGLIVLGDDNENLTKNYESRAFKATEGVDPTWDAGVIIKNLPRPVPPEENPDNEKPGNEKPAIEDPESPATPGVPATPEVQKPDQGKEMPNTGAAVTGAALAALALAVLGAGALHLVRRKS